MALDLMPAALAGFNAAADDECPHANTSPNGNAWKAGRWLRTTGRSAPRSAATSRGHRLRVNDMLLVVDSQGNVTRIE